MLTIYGIKNCDTVQRACKRLAEVGIEYRFHDFRSAGLAREKAQSWIDALGVDTVVNRRGTTWRKLDEATREGLNEHNAAELLAREPSLVKRPVIEGPKGVTVGFTRDDEAGILARLGD